MGSRLRASIYNNYGHTRKSDCHHSDWNCRLSKLSIPKETPGSGSAIYIASLALGGSLSALCRMPA
jgi:hypothetical protein